MKNYLFSGLLALASCSTPSIVYDSDRHTTDSAVNDTSSRFISEGNHCDSSPLGTWQSPVTDIDRNECFGIYSDFVPATLNEQLSGWPEQSLCAMIDHKTCFDDFGSDYFTINENDTTEPWDMSRITGTQTTCYDSGQVVFDKYDDTSSDAHTLWSVCWSQFGPKFPMDEAYSMKARYWLFSEEEAPFEASDSQRAFLSETIPPLTIEINCPEAALGPQDCSGAIYK